MAAEMDNRIEGIDRRPTISSLFLPSVKQVPRGDGFSRQTEWINGKSEKGRRRREERREGGRGKVRRWLRPRRRAHRVAVSSGQQSEVAGLLLTRLKEVGRRRGLGWTERLESANTHIHTHTQSRWASSKPNDGWGKSPASPSPLLRRLALWMEWLGLMNIHAREWCSLAQHWAYKLPIVLC